MPLITGQNGPLLQGGCLILRLAGPLSFKYRGTCCRSTALAAFSAAWYFSHYAQRPCSRCVSTNKEAACVDVQHKKRGRPRLRDDGQARYEGSRFGSAADAMRRPLVYDPGPRLGMVHDDPVRRSQSYRVLKSQPAEPIAPRFLERGLASDANVYPAPLSIAPARAPEEPVAYLTIGLEFSRVSPSFLSAIGRSSVTGVDFANVLVAEDRPRASRLRQQAQEEQTRKDPAYLPPIFNERSEAVMQSLSFTPEQVSRYPLHWLDTFTFLGDDGHARPISVRAGLASRDSIYFVVLLLNRTSQPSYPTPSPSSLRDLGGSFDPGLQPYSQSTPPSATFDSRQSRLSDAGHHDPRQTAQPTGGSSLHMLPVRSPSLLSSPYGLSPGRADYPITPRAYQVPRTEAHPSGRPSQLADYQLPLPRIRSPPLGTSQQRDVPQTQQSLPPPPAPPAPPPPHPPPPPAAAAAAAALPPYQAREERSRIEIGGLIEQPETRESPQR
ncbi:uncharacterized protein P884DRAFT_286392 [Thermothelomyces heterothallicus CBS 202.75]|uniref:uncharacterized protein n=1 Tax=Thermothelomyces heterothallicus CBS 202.75 TaxID=1149848 RepID=UPI0037425FDE